MGYYNPKVGRFTQADPYWNPGNMIYGDNPALLREYKDALGLSAYTYAPSMYDIRASGNLYAYCLNSPIALWDPWGLKPVDIDEFLKQFDGYDISYDSKTGKYTVTLNGKTLTFDSSGKNGHEMGIWVENGKLTAEDYDLAYYFRVSGWVEYFPGFQWRDDGAAFSLDTGTYFLSKSFCKDFADEIMRMKGTMGFMGVMKYSGITLDYLQAELYAHAVMLMYTTVTTETFGRGYSYLNSAKVIDIDAGDPRSLRFYMIWRLVGTNTGNPLAGWNVFG